MKQEQQQEDCQIIKEHTEKNKTQWKEQRELQ